MTTFEAINALNALYNLAADLTALTYQQIDSTMDKLDKSFDKNGIKEVAKGFGVRSNLTTKTAIIDRINHKISDRKAKAERGQVIAAAVVREEEVYEVELV
jgi:hypothetical protein